MGLLDRFLSSKPEVSAPAQKPVVQWKELYPVYGKSGTKIMSGMVDEEYLSELAFPQSVEVFNQMRKSDGTVIALLKAIKNPILSAKWQIQSGGEDKRDKEIADFVQKNLFEKIQFNSSLRQAMTFLDFWFFYFEKIFEVVDGMIEWKALAPRVQSAHYLWGIQGKEWVDGHPAGITQQLQSSDDDKPNDSKNYPTIPWNKLILFTNDQEGNNFEGVSILRQAYKHWYYKDLMYKISSISAERYGVGIPVAKVKSSMKDSSRKKVEEWLKNIRSNEKSYGVLTDDIIEFIIKTPDGTGVGSQVKDNYEHHDRKMYDSILAGFINLTPDDGGNNALSKDQSSFFLEGLQGLADYIVGAFQPHIKELVDLNYANVERYPKLMVSDVGTISMDEQIGAINTAVSGGIIQLTPDDTNYIRSTLKLPQLPPPDEEDAEIDELEAQLAIEELHVATLDDFSPMTNPDGSPMETSDEDGEDPATDEELSEAAEMIQLGKPLSDEHKKKISDALKKALPGPYKDMETPTLGSMYEKDKDIQDYQKQKQNLTNMITNVRNVMQSIKDKKASMSKVQKKAFAGEFKQKIAELTESRKSLQMLAKQTRDKEKKRKDALRVVHKEVRSHIKEGKKAERETAKVARESERAEKKRQREREKSQRAREREQKKQEREAAKAAKAQKLAEGDYTGCVMLNVEGLDKPKIDTTDLAETSDFPLHVTLLYGLDTSLSGKEISEKISYTDQAITIEKMTVFEKDDKDVLVLEVKKDDWIMGINSSLRELDYKNEYPDYTPHITLAYLKKGTAEKYMTDEYNGKALKGTDIVYTKDEDGKAVKLSTVGIEPTEREVAFTNNITSFEEFLEMKLDEVDEIIADAEAELTEAIIELYDDSTSDRFDGVECLVYDKTRITAGKNKVLAISKRLEKALIDSKIQDQIFDEAIAAGKRTLIENDKKLGWTLDIPAGQVNTFIEGYKSNMQGVIYNDTRRVLENITLNFWSEASLDLARKTAEEIHFNRNILTLSFVTHPRALYKFIIFDESVAEGFTLFKTIVPANRYADLVARPFWITAGIVFTINTAAQINKYASQTTDGKTAEAVTGLGLHHGSFEYYYPIESANIDAEQEIARIQREELRKASDNNS